MRPRQVILITAAVLLVVITLAVNLIYFNKSASSEKARSLPLLDIVKGKPLAIRIESPAIRNESQIPTKYTCDGEAVSPPLVITDIPANIRELIVIMYDPDAPRGVFYHWLLYGIRPSTKIMIPEALPPRPIISGLGMQGLNSYGSIGYGPPCPPHGSRHRYVFLVIGLVREENLPPGLDPSKLLKLVKPYVGSYGVFYAYYSR